MFNVQSAKFNCRIHKSPSLGEGVDCELCSQDGVVVNIYPLSLRANEVKRGNPVNRIK